MSLARPLSRVDVDERKGSASSAWVGSASSSQEVHRDRQDHNGPHQLDHLAALAAVGSLGLDWHGDRDPLGGEVVEGGLD